MKAKHVTTLLWLATIGSCAAGKGLESVGHSGWGTGLIALGTGLFFYLVIVRES